ncbi:CHC2 zinc finger domain-containing protein [Knoellia locipacati]|uniref:CHC2 zinc finger domain-containing protein n=1 Tax=Knoellia locipacati TaxID=882824 RepID=UPI00384F037A
MTATGIIDVADVRARHRIEDVVAASGVELRATGKSLMGCCPLHEDDTASLSVGGIPDRFHCFGCGASGDVIEYVARLRNLTFRDAVAYLENDHSLGMPSAPRAPVLHLPRPPAIDVAPERAWEINEMAWQRWTRPVNHAFALSWLRNHRGLDVAPVEATLGSQVVGHTGAEWTTTTHHLSRAGVSDDELLALDLAQRTRRGTLIDSLRGRLVVPVRDPAGHLTGFIGRETLDNSRGPKYRNPTRTAVFDKSTMLYSLASHPHASAHVVVVEGPLDVLAVAAAAVSANLPVIAVSTGGTSVSRDQARQVSTLSPQRVFLAFDGDPAGRDGATRWVDLLHRHIRHPVAVADLPSGRDPADWIAEHGSGGLRSLLTQARHPAYELAQLAPSGAAPAPKAAFTPRM